MFRFVSCFLLGGWVLLSSLGTASSAYAQDPSAPADNAAGQDAAAAFQAINAKWLELDKKLAGFDTRFREAKPEDRVKLRDEYIVLVTEARAFLPKLSEAALAAYKAAPNKDENVTQVLLGVSADAIHRDDYDLARTITDLLLANKCTVPGLNNLAGTAAYCTDDFARAETLLTAAQKEEAISPEAQHYLDDIPEAKKLYAVELETRKKEAAKDDLPRVKLETNKGVIVIELFENEAPEAVGNFVSLVEKGFYNGLTFHRVLPGFMAQGGCPEGTGTGGPGYNIRCECYQENHRNHFRGTLSMAHAGRDTGGSQFFITFLRTPHLDGRHTAFGRVVEGMDVLAKLQRRDPQRSNVEPDKIVKAEVIRKRDHKYEPKPVE